MLLYDAESYLNWLQSLSKGDNAYLFNARSFRRLHSSPITLNKSTKKIVGHGISEIFSRANGLEAKRDPRRTSWEGMLRIMPDKNFSFLDDIYEEIENQGFSDYYAACEIETLFCMAIYQAINHSSPIKYSQLKEKVIQLFLRERQVIPGYTGVAGDELVSLLKSCFAVESS